MHDLPPQPGVGAGVRQHRGVVLLRPGDRGPPLEEADRVGAAGHVLQAVAQHLARALRVVGGLPVDRARGVLHQDPGRTAGEPAGPVRAQRQLHVRGVQTAHQVVVVAHHVLLGGPAPVVGAVEVAHHHEVRGDRDAGAQPVQHVALGAVLVEQLLGAEPAEVQLLGGVELGGTDPGRLDLVPVGVVLGPERRPPGRVQGLEGAVALAQPPAERPRAHVAVAVRVVAAELVGDVPHREGRMVRVAGGDVLHQRQRVPAVDRRARAPALPAPVAQAPALYVDREHLGMGPGQPRRRRGGRRGEVHRDAVVVHQVEHDVEPVEVPGAGSRLDPRPREHPDRHEGDPGLAHQPRVLRPDALGPLLGVVVAAVPQAPTSSETRMPDQRRVAHTGQSAGRRS